MFDVDGSKPSSRGTVASLPWLRAYDRPMNGRATSTAIAINVHGPRDPTVTKVVLVHGAMDRAKSFRSVVQHLPDLRVTDYDRRGYGESIPAVPPASLAQHVEDLLDVMGDRTHHRGRPQLRLSGGRLGSDLTPRTIPGTWPVGAASAVDGVLARLGQAGP